MQSGKVNTMIPQTPCILVDKKQLSHEIDRFLSIGMVYYPVKANSFSGIIDLLTKKGACFSVSAVYYLDMLYQLEVPCERILWDNCFSTEQDLDYVISKGVGFFTVDSQDSISYIQQKCPEAEFLIRISNDVVAETHYKYGSLDPIKLMDKVKNGKLRGVSFHLGKDLFDYESLKKMMEYISTLGKVNTVDIGGGYEDLFFDPRIVELLEKYRAEQLFENIIFEPGRGLLNSVCKMYSKVLAVRSHNDQNWARIDASIYSGLMDVYIEEKKFKVFDNSCSKKPYLVLGCTPDSGDSLGIHELSSDLKSGDIVVIDRCGAYCHDMSCCYSGARKLSIDFLDL